MRRNILQVKRELEQLVRLSLEAMFGFIFSVFEDLRDGLIYVDLSLWA